MTSSALEVCMLPVSRMMNTYTIAEAAKMLGVTAHALRYYESAGLLQTVARTEGKARRYDEPTLDLARLLLKLRATGMPIRKIRAYVDLVHEGETSMPVRQSIIRQHRDEVDSQIAELTLALEILDSKLKVYELGISMSDLAHPVVIRLNELLKGPTK